MSSQYGELRPSNGWDWLASLGHPSKFQQVSRLGFVTAATLLTESQPNSARCLVVSWAGTLCIHFRGLLPPDTILPGAKFTLRPSLSLSSTGSFTARHSSSGCRSNFAARCTRNGITELSHLYSAGRPSRWASVHILVYFSITSRKHNKASIRAKATSYAKVSRMSVNSWQRNCLYGKGKENTQINARENIAINDDGRP